jgi:predicted O-methyltransferase YrrM
MNTNDLRNFMQVSADVVQQSKELSWTIPDTADKAKGDLGLLPSDTIIEAWQIPTSSAMLLRFLVLLTGAQTILELGASIGFSTLWLALGAKETGGHVTTTEIFAEKAAIARTNIERAGLSDQVTLYEQDILDVLRAWPQDRPIDLVFMDADKQRYAKYLEALLPLLSTHGLVVVDNAGNYRKYMVAFIEEGRRLDNCVVQYLGIDNGLLLIATNVGTNFAPMIDLFDPNHQSGAHHA